MVYSNRFVMSVLVHGNVQKELANGVVPVDFGSEYSLRFRNKNNRRAVVRFTIDNENVSGNGYIIPANSAIDIHRHWDKDAKFKFVELDSPDAVDFGKNGPNLDGSKGVVEARFYLEKTPPVTIPWPSPPVYHHHHHHHHHHKKNLWSEQIGGTYGGSSGASWGSNKPETWPNLSNPAPIPQTINFSSLNIPQTINCTMPDFPKSAVPPKELQEGCTVEGSMSGQSFYTSYIDLETDYVALKVILKGKKAETPSVFHVETSAQVPYCTNCGAKKVRAKDNFCGICGHKF